MIRDIVWACIVCGREGALDDAGTCRACGASYTRGRGAHIVVNGEPLDPLDIAQRLPQAGSTGQAHALLRTSTGDRKVRALGHYLGRVEQLGPERKAVVTLTDSELRIAADDGVMWEIPLEDITAIQPSSHALQIKVAHRPVLSLRFVDSSPKLWEERLQNALTASYARAGRADIVEYQPRVCIRRTRAGNAAGGRIRKLVARGANLRPPRPWQYRLASWIATSLWRRFGGGLHVRGLENIPQRGPFLILPNHQSYLETLFVPAVLPRPAWSMAKSTQFGARVVGPLMAQLLTFPVRRFEIDPHTLRFLLRRFSEGYGVVIYPEGERTWDGAVQPLRLGVVRLALGAGVPVIPCRVDGAFEAWPRWSSRPQRHAVQLSFGKPMHLASASSATDCEAALEPALDLIRDAISR